MADARYCARPAVLSFDGLTAPRCAVHRRPGEPLAVVAGDLCTALVPRTGSEGGWPR